MILCELNGVIVQRHRNAENLGCDDPLQCNFGGSSIDRVPLYLKLVGSIDAREVHLAGIKGNLRDFRSVDLL